MRAFTVRLHSWQKQKQQRRRQQPCCVGFIAIELRRRASRHLKAGPVCQRAATQRRTKAAALNSGTSCAIALDFGCALQAEPAPVSQTVSRRRSLSDDGLREQHLHRQRLREQRSLSVSMAAAVAVAWVERMQQWCRCCCRCCCWPSVACQTQ